MEEKLLENQSIKKSQSTKNDNTEDNLVFEVRGQ